MPRTLMRKMYPKQCVILTVYPSLPPQVLIYKIYYYGKMVLIQAEKWHILCHVRYVALYRLALDLPPVWLGNTLFWSLK